MLNAIQPRVVEQIRAIDRDAWNALTKCRFPFLRHEFLSALEHTGCLGEKTGWVPKHMVFEDSQGHLAAALPMYLKFNSFGEFVFDWAWAEAYTRAGIDYYPKFVVAAPFTPATGPRVLLNSQYASTDLYQKVIDAAIELAESMRISSLHWLFTTDSQRPQSSGLLRRLGCQFHWNNQSYLTFDEFLSHLTSKRRKQIKKERRQVTQANLELVRLSGHEVDDATWDVFHQLYSLTFDRHGNFPALTNAFFKEIASTMGEQIMLVLAKRDERIIAASYFLVGSDTLYGRYWGCFEEFPSLHFEACYYQGLEHCIENGLSRFEPGAQGEHKISRGFLPTETWSLHWIRDQQFRLAIENFLEREVDHMHDYMNFLNSHSPFKKTARADSA